MKFFRDLLGLNKREKGRPPLQVSRYVQRRSEDGAGAGISSTGSPGKTAFYRSGGATYQQDAGRGRKKPHKKPGKSIIQQINEWMYGSPEEQSKKLEVKNKKLYYHDLKKRHEKEKKKFRRKKMIDDFLIRYNLKKDKHSTFSQSESKRQFTRLMSLMVNSFVMFILAYIIAYLVYQFAVMFIAAHFGINSILYYYEVLFPIGNSSPLWNNYNIIMITFAGPLISLLIGTIIYRFILRRDKVTGQTKLFLLWISLHMINLFFGALIAGMITDQGFGYVIAWLFIPTTIRFLLAIIALFILGLIGYSTTRHILESTNSNFWTKKENKPRLFFFYMLVPWFVGSLLLFILKIPNNLPQHENIMVYDTIGFFSMVFLIIPAFFNTKARPSSSQIRGMERSKEEKVNLRYLTVLGIALLLFRLGLNYGLYYSLHLSGTIYPLGG